MVLQAPDPTRPDTDVDAGVIEEARRRQQRQRRAGAWLLCAVAAAALLAGLAAGGRGSGGSGGRPGARPSGSSPSPGAAQLSATNDFPGAPASQRNGYGVESNTCPLAQPNAYLPPRAGCVFVRRLDMSGDGQRDLVIVYSILSRRHPNWFAGTVPAAISKNYVPLRAYIKVIPPGGRSVSTPISGSRGSDTAAIDFVTRIGARAEVFLGVARGAGFAADVAYGFDSGRLTPAGVILGFGGDSASAQSFSCVPGNSAQLVTRTLSMIGPSIYGWWRERVDTYAWRDGALVQTATSVLKRHGYPDQAARSDGLGCVRS